MSTKKLQESGIRNELQGASLYFTRPPETVSSSQVNKQDPKTTVSEYPKNLIDQKEGDSGSLHASMQASKHVSKPDDLIETVRKTVKQVGKEQLFVRLTPAEKDQLRAAVHTLNEVYRRAGRKTSENEVSRIAIKYLLEDYRRHGDASILAITQAALHA